MKHTYTAEIWSTDYDCITITCKQLKSILTCLDEWVAKHGSGYSELLPAKVYRDDGALAALLVPEMRQLLILHRPPCITRARYLRVREWVKWHHHGAFITIVRVEALVGLITNRYATRGLLL